MILSKNILVFDYRALESMLFNTVELLCIFLQFLNSFIKNKKIIKIRKFLVVLEF